MRSAILPLSAALLVMSLTPALASAQTLVGRADSVYTWRGTIPANGMFVIRNFNGPIDVRPSNGSTAELRAEKRTRGGDVRDVGFEVQTASNGDVTICSAHAENDSCDGDRNRRDNGWRREVTVAMTVLVPRGVQLKV
ncbi:MAG: hypothetical protein JWL95_1259, partial [Gemmatimonadetes bacterium]|nr:hypothetical protein [Gemmatimonadota bacterium]